MRVAVSAAIVLLGLVAAAGLPFGAAFVGYGFGASVILWVIAGRPSGREMLLCIVAACVAAGANWLGLGPLRPLKVEEVLGFLGLAAMVLIALKVVWSQGEAREQSKRILMPAVAMAFLVVASQNLLAIPSLIASKTYDLYAFVVDGSLGFQPSFLVGQVYQHHAWIAKFGEVTYYGLPVAMAVLYALHLRHEVSEQWYVLELLFGAGIAGYLLYNVFPAGGPIYVFANIFPDQPLPYATLKGVQLELVSVGLRFPRNAMPSLHMAWALLIWFSCWPLRRWARLLALTYVLVTVLDTLGTGEHYLIDLVVAVPFSVAMQAICARTLPMKGSRALALGMGAGLTGVWLVVLREWPRMFLVSPAVAWASFVGSTVVSLVVVGRLLQTFYASEHLVALTTGASADSAMATSRP